MQKLDKFQVLTHSLIHKKVRNDRREQLSIVVVYLYHQQTNGKFQFDLKIFIYFIVLLVYILNTTHNNRLLKIGMLK